MSRPKFFIGGYFFLFCCIFFSKITYAMTFNGPITANDVTVTGNITISSMTISSITVSNLLNIQGETRNLGGLILQTKFSSTTVQFDTTNTSTTAITGMLATLSLLNSNNYVRISMSGTLGISVNMYIGSVSIFRDSILLGTFAQTYSGNGSGSCSTSVGITIVDSPGDTNQHTYQADIQTSNSAAVASFTTNPVGYFLVQEIGQK